MNNISFIIPAYNSEKTLAESVNSIFNGNFLDGDEVIIVNDGSTDNTLEIAKGLAEKYSPKIKIIDNIENKGCPASRNIGISQAKNDLIFNLDSDNILIPGNIAKIKEAIIREQADIAAFGEYHYFKDDSKEVTHKWLCKTGVLTLADFFSGMTNPGPGGNFLYKKETWNRIGKYWEYGKGLHEAWGFSFKMLVNGAKFIVVPKTAYLHRYSHESLFVRENKKQNEGVIITNKMIGPFLRFFSEETLNYIKKEPNWYERLNYRPLKLKDGSIGINGKVVFTNKLKNYFEPIKELVKKYLC